MSNLSDLLPAGGGAKVITATASGNLATGQTVALQSDGTVKAVSETAGGVGSEYVYESAVTSFGDVAYDSVNNQVIAVYRDEGNSNYGTYVVGTVSGTVITWGTPAVWLSALATDIAIASGNGKLLIAFSDGGNSSYGTVIAGAISGSSISFGTKAVIHSGGQLYETYALYFSPSDNPTYAHRYIVGYSQGGARINANLIEITGTNTISNGGQYEPNGSSNGGGIGLAYAADQTGKNIIISFKDGSDSNKIKYARASYSAGSPGSLSFGGVGFAATNGNFSSVAWDTSASKVLLAYKSVSSSNELRYQVGTFSGTEDITWETAVTSTATVDTGTRLVYDATANKSVLLYDQDNDSGKGKVAYVSISGTTATIGTIYDFNGGDTSYFNVAYDSTAGVNTIVFTDRGNSEYGTGVVFRDTTSNSADFVGITNQAINNSASGEVVVEGGAITNGSLLPLTYSGSLGTAANFIAGTNPEHVSSCFDSSSGKTIISYVGNSNYGYVVVGTPNASDNTITFGTPVAFNSSTTTTTSITYDVAQNKVLIAYSNGGNGYYIWAVVGTVSGTTVSLGTASAQTSAASSNTAGFATVYDVNAAKHVLAFQNETSSNRLDAQVMTISGTSVSSGSALTNIAGGACAFPSTAYDSSAQKVVIAYQDTGSSTHGKAVVASVSGTSISAGSEVSFNAAVTYNTVTEYDPSANKIIIAYKNNQTPTAVVGTVSGTSISFGSATVVAALSGSGFYGGTFDTTANKFIVAFLDEDDDPDNGKYAIGSVDGTNITFTTPATFNAGAGGGQLTRYISPSYNATADRTVISFQNGASSNGTSRVLQLTGATTNFTIGSTYYVQDDGTLSTTSSSVTAGKAIANTTLLLKG